MIEEGVLVVRKVLGFVKTMILGGLLFLFPLVIVTAVVGKAFRLMLRVTEPFDDVIPADSVADVAVVNLVAIGALLVGCFVAGLVAQSKIGRRVYRTADANLEGIIPGYAALKARLGSAVGEERRKAFKAVFVRFDDQGQIAFEVERLADGRVTVFLPGAPDPWSGAVLVVDADRVTPVDLEILPVSRTFKNLGRGTAAALGQEVGTT
jgi:uncharacterized membrane protein